MRHAGTLAGWEAVPTGLDALTDPLVTPGPDAAVGAAAPAPWPSADVLGATMGAAGTWLGAWAGALPGAAGTTGSVRAPAAGWPGSAADAGGCEDVPAWG
jgi:hypothetical protein